MKLKSQWSFSQASECRRGLMCGMGYSAEEQNRPRIAVVNSWNEYNPGHVHLKQLAERVKAGIRDAGGLPLEEAVRLYGEGAKLAESCQKELEQAKLTVSEYTKPAAEPANT